MACSEAAARHSKRSFPALPTKWLARGALLGDVTDDVLWCNEGAFHFRFHSSLTGVLLSRPLLEYQVRARTLALPNVRLQRAEASGPSIDHSRRRVTGVERVEFAELPKTISGKIRRVELRRAEQQREVMQSARNPNEWWEDDFR
jgi:hypothetical protein